jgi:hypothetical protein
MTSDPNRACCSRTSSGFYTYFCEAGYTMENSSCIKRTYSCEDGYTLQADNTCKLN